MADEDGSAGNLSGSGRTRKRGLAATEPPEYVDDTKTCPNPKCGSSKHCVFKFLNNGKRDQPRYRCTLCKHMHTHYPPGKEHPPRPHGKPYKKHTLANPPEHCNRFDLRCPNPACGSENRRPRFLYYNNNKNPSQPRYKCLVCNVAWQPKQKATLPVQPDLEGVPTLPTHAEYDDDVGSCSYIQGAAPIPMQDDDAQALEEFATMGPEDLDVMMGLLLQQRDDPAHHDMKSMGSCTELYPNGDPNIVDVMQGSHLQQQQCDDPADHDVNTMGSCAEYVARVNHTMQGQQPHSETSQDCQDQDYVNGLGCAPDDPSIRYNTMLQAGDPSGHISTQVPDQEQLSYLPPEWFASSDTVHVGANVVEVGDQEQLSYIPPEWFTSSDTVHVGANVVEGGGEQCDFYSGLDPDVYPGLDSWHPEDMGQWISELVAANGP